MGLAVFLYQVVLEKEARLIETMKMNGMRMSNYWLVNFLFNLGFYIVTMMLFVLFGMKIFKLQVFTESNFALIIFILLGWGLGQIGMAFFVSVFLSKSQTATIIGYTIAVWLTTIAGCFNITVYSPPNHMDWFLFLLPSFTFSRLMYFLSIKCGYENCVADFSQMDPEMILCLFFLYFMAAVYTVLALYLYQVFPQTFGVPKKWNYLCKRQQKTGNKTGRDTDEIGDLEQERE